ncbi:hypothetical protein I3760_13G074700 [Carya illinoinensis]|nr:hypothetical protein I3760_13G074700 [Carya illinoinensis]
MSYPSKSSAAIGTSSSTAPRTVLMELPATGPSSSTSLHSTFVESPVSLLKEEDDSIFEAAFFLWFLCAPSSSQCRQDGAVRETYVSPGDSPTPSEEETEVGEEEEVEEGEEEEKEEDEEEEVEERNEEERAAGGGGLGARRLGLLIPPLLLGWETR